MWSGPEAAGGGVTTHPELRRGHVWLAQVAPDRGYRAVLLLSRDVDDAVLAAPVVRGARATGRVAVDFPAGVEGAVVDVRRLTAIDRSGLIQPLAQLAAPRLAEVDRALCDVLGIDAAAPVVHHATLDQLGFAPPPAPPPVSQNPASMPDVVRDVENTHAGLDDHPIAQLFGRPRPVTQQAAPARAPARPAADIRVADVMPELLAIVQRRLHRSAPRLESLLSQAGEEGRTVEWVAAAVRHASVRGVMQSTLDEIATEIAAVGAPQGRSRAT